VVLREGNRSLDPAQHGPPKGWRIGGETGSGGHGTANDTAIAWPPDRAALVVYLTESSAPAEHRDATLAAAGQAVAVVMG